MRDRRRVRWADRSAWPSPASVRTSDPTKGREPGVSGSIVIGADHLTAIARAQRPPGLEVDRVLDEPDRAVAEECIDAAGVEAPRRDDAVLAGDVHDARP